MEHERERPEQNNAYPARVRQMLLARSGEMTGIKAETSVRRSAYSIAIEQINRQNNNSGEGSAKERNLRWTTTKSLKTCRFHKVSQSSAKGKWAVADGSWVRIYRVSHIRYNTGGHERGCAACPRREQGKATLRRLAAVKTR
jgi:hypothetical protein